MHNLRYWIRLTTAFIARFKLLLLIGIGIGLFGFVGLEYLIPQLEAKTEQIGIVGEYTTYQLPASILNLIGSGLTKLDTSGQPVPSIAKSWEASDSGKIWIFHLNPNFKWQDGSKLVAADIDYNFGDATVTRPDKYTVIFKLSSPFAPFPTIVSRPIFKMGLLGVGDWKVSGLTLAGTYVESLTITDKDNNRKIFKFYPTEERAKLAFELGEVVKIQDMVDSKPFDAWSTTNIAKSVNKQRYVAIFFNTADDILSDKDMRQALSYAINKDALSQDRALGPISPDSWAYNPQMKPYDFNADRAKELITQSKINPDSRKNLKIKLTTVPDLLPIAESVAKDWKAVGVDTTLQVTSYLPDQYQAFLATYDIPADPDQYSTWHSTQVQTNISKYKNPRIDKLLEDGRLETDQNKRERIYFDFQRFLIEDAPAAFLYYPPYYTITKK